MQISRRNGFTLVELLVALAVAAVLLGVGVPSFAEVVRGARLSTQYNAVVAALYLARSEAVKSSEFVTVCARASDTACGGVDDWENGWITFVDPSAGSAGAAASIDAADTVLRIDGPIAGDNTVTAYRVVPDASGSLIDAITGGGGGVTEQKASFVRYQPRGDAHWGTGSIRVCDANRGADVSRVVNVVLTGDVRPGRKSGDETAPRDVANRPIACPAPTA